MKAPTGVLEKTLHRPDDWQQSEPETIPRDSEFPQSEEVGGDDASVFMSLAALQQRPELLKPPESVLNRIAYRGRGVALCGPDKSGKSTLMRHATTAITLGRSFLGGPTQVGRVVLLGLEARPRGTC